MNFRKIVFLAFAATLSLFISCSDDPKPTDEIEVPEGYSLVWSDEFDGTSIDPTNWVFETGDGTDYGLPVGWGNNEKQLYTTEAENAAIMTDEGESVLAITAREASSGYTSAKLTTQDLVSVRFGRIDIRAKLPKGQGIWPAFWLLGDNRGEISWPGCGEIDIIEVLGHEPNKMYSTVHYTNSENSKGENQGSYTLPSGNLSDSYHVFSLDWTPESMTFFIDGTQVHQVAIADDMKEFRRSMYMILNIAVGGYWPGEPDATTTFPQTFYVDYVRVFADDALEAPAAPALDIAEETIGQIIEASVALEAIQTDFSLLQNIEVLAWGGGGEPDMSTSEVAVDGDFSLAFNFPGGAWGGGYLLLENPTDVSSFTHLTFSLHKPEALTTAEIKLESPATNAVVFLADYTGTPVANGFVEYSIPLSDFAGLDLTKVTIPFAMWNPQDVAGGFVAAEVLLDDLHFE